MGQIIKSYLSEIQQSVCIRSRPRTITYGVLQGTVLGPLLFRIYINSSLHLNINGKIFSFVDDTVCYAKARPGTI